MHPQLAKLAKGLTGVFLLGFGFAYFGLSTKTVSSLITTPSPMGVSFLLLLLAGFAWMLHEILNQVSYPSAMRTRFRPKLAWPKENHFKIALSAVILLQVCLSMSGPLEYDERSITTLFSGGLLEVLKPFRAAEFHTQNTNQSLATLFSYLTTSVFGITKFGIRLAPVLCTLGLLVLLFFATRGLSAITIVLLYLHLASNELAVWYLHVAKGYVTMMVGAAALIFLIRDVSARSSRVLFVTMLVFTIFSHTFGALFAILLLASLIVWLYLNRQTMPEDLFTAYTNTTLYGVATLPLIAFVFCQHLGQVEGRGELFREPSTDLVYNVGYIFGLSQVWWSKLLLILTGGMLFLRAKQEKKLSSDLLFIFSVTSLVFFVVVCAVMKPSTLYPRTLLAWVIPLVIWMGQTLHSLQRPVWRTLLTTAAAVLLVVVPLFSMSHVRNTIVLGAAPYEAFVDGVKRRTANVEKPCYQFFGFGEEPKWASLIYFHGPQPKDCRHTYLLKFNQESLEEQKELLHATLPPLKILWTGPEGRALYQVARP